MKCIMYYVNYMHKLQLYAISTLYIRVSLSFRLPELGLCPTPKKAPSENTHTNINNSNINDGNTCGKPLKKKRRI